MMLRRVKASLLYRLRNRIRGATEREQWLRLVMNEEIDQFLAGLGPEVLDAIEVSGDLHGPERWPWRSYQTTSYPDFDLSGDPELPGQFDVVICEQVLEHVPDPIRAVRTLHDLARAGGHVVISTPFLVKIHGNYGDYWRFTPDGLRLLIESSGLQITHVGAWGNTACAKANLWTWRRRLWGSMKNSRSVPLVVWAFARRPVVGSVDRTAPELV